MSCKDILFPLPMLPSIPDNLDSLDSRKALPFLMAFMKNTLIRGLNNVHQVAPLLNSNNPRTIFFLKYITSLCKLLRTHLEGDRLFFSLALPGGKALRDIVSIDCHPDLTFVHKALDQVESKLDAWTKNPASYCSLTLRQGIEFAPTMIVKMQVQLNLLSFDYISSLISDKDLRPMIQANMEWFASHSDITFLLPFVISHHDTSTSPHWPTITEQGAAALPSLIKEHAGCWEFAPIDPLTKQTNPMVF
ncbi:hypothetical protein SERLA73DRAFT_159508 [Serpula lacrymans var. lacrymans S7.3]|uniref:Uncharacterized protein n=2 Tax=Serpula lacrymans var. lacrymans TaxID=341189 RepID=F8PT38_SERL3|nr:uncharacterized protein SERLADRAFT_436303 [Serpula lacrymans var. lacrymans S7.9]EGO00868.1 hypothetical protein SERLA73DRAFT_159508 [Serpula lacrymans var. lacrymans S7.3]EGO26487.1 hypothetical protein SERLADRAFT_436303 [Serpula lacrymans var. lacrymans S7.9]